MADVVTRLRVESSEYEQKLKRATSTLQKMESDCRKVAGTMAIAEKEDIKFAESLGRMETQARNARGKISELSNAFTEASLVYKRLTDEEKKSPFGQALSRSVDQLKTRLNEAKAELKGVESSLGNVGKGGALDFKSALTELGSQLGINGNVMQLATTGTLAYGAAIGGVATAVAAASKAFADYNSEIAKLDNQTSVVLGIKDEGQIAKITDQLRAYCDVYNADFTQAVNAANTLIQQFGISSDEALSILKKGFQGMLPQDAGKLLQMIQQFAPSFRDAGISASQLVAIIHNSEGGIFTDANMNAIVMGIKNIRLMKDTTKDALRSIGVDADSMSQKLNSGTMSVFEALQQVSNAVTNVGSGSQAAGEVMNDIFGRQGVAAGQNLGKAIAQLNTNLDQTKTQTGELGESMRILADRTNAFDEACRRAFQVDGWEGLTNELKGNVLNALTKIVDCIGDVEDALSTCKGYFDDMGEAGTIALNAIKTGVLKALGPLGDAVKLLKEMFSYLGQDPEPKQEKKGGRRTVYKAKDGKVYNTREEALNHNKQIKPTKPDPKPTKVTTTTKTQKETFNEGEVGYYKERISELSKTQNHVTSPEEWKKLQDEIDATTKKIDEIQGKVKEVKAPDLTFGISGLNTEAFSGYISMLQEQLKKADFGTPLRESIQQNLADANMLQNILNKASLNGIDISGFNAEGMWDVIMNAKDIPDYVWTDLADTINEHLKSLGLDPIKLDFATGNISTDKQTEKPEKTDKKEGKTLQKLDSSISGLDGIANGLQALGVELPQGLTDTISTLQSIMTIVNGVASLLSIIEIFDKANGTAQTALLSEIAAATTVTATASTVDAIIPFSTGGTIPVQYAATGKSFAHGTDTVPAMLSPGETVLTRAQTGNLASQLNQVAQGRNAQLSATIHGEDIRLALNNNSRRRGRGEYVTSKRS